MFDLHLFFKQYLWFAKSNDVITFSQSQALRKRVQPIVWVVWVHVYAMSKYLIIVNNTFPLSDLDKIWYVDLFWGSICYFFIIYPKFRSPEFCPPRPYFYHSVLKTFHCPIKIKFGM